MAFRGGRVAIPTPHATGGERRPVGKRSTLRAGWSTLDEPYAAKERPGDEPPSADRLYTKIQSAVRAHQDDPLRLFDAEEEIAEFISHYPEDERAREVEAYQGQLQAMRRRRNLERRAERELKKNPNSVLARLYAEAIDLAEKDPERAAARLRALIDLFGQDKKPSETAQLFIPLARQQIERLKEQLQLQRVNHLALMKANNIPMITEPAPWAPPEPKGPKKTDAAPPVHARGFRHQKKGGRGRSKGK